MEKLLTKIYDERRTKEPRPSIDFRIKKEEREVINYIKLNLEKSNFKNLILNLFKKDIENKILLKRKSILKIKNILKIEKENIFLKKEILDFYYSEIEKLEEKILNLKTREITLNNIYSLIISDFLKIEKINYMIYKVHITKNEYLYKNIMEFLYFNYLKYIAEPKWQINKKNNLLEEHYSFLKEDNQYQKYKLLHLDKYRSVVKYIVRDGAHPFYIIDKRIEKYIEIQDIDFQTLSFLIFLKNNNFIKDLSLRPNYYKKIKETPRQLILDSKEFGKHFHFKNLNKILPTKLYSLEGDSLWINIDKENITFEEILNNFEIVNDDTIVTQVLHCEYFLENNDFFIKHMDHEYIFYSLDEFEKRQNNIKQKGSKFQRVKTFKIDNSKIPFILNNKNVLLFFLNQYFESEELLLEYFNKIES